MKCATLAHSVQLVDALLPIVIGAATAAVVVLAARHLILRRHAEGDSEATRTARRKASDVTLAVIGLLVMVLSLVVGLRILAVEPPPQGELYEAGVGFAPDVAARPGRGFVVGLAARFTDCNDPVEVTIAIAGTAEYFEDNENALRRRTGFTIAVPGKGIDEIALGYGGGGYEDALKPSLAKRTRWRMVDPVRREEARVTPRTVTSIRGSVGNWSSHLHSLVVTFDADWLSDRGLGTCYLALPPLAGEYSILGAQDARGRSAGSVEEALRRFPTAILLMNGRRDLVVSHAPALFVRNGVAVVPTGGHEILRIEPAANTNSAGVPALACSKPPLEPGRLGSPAADVVELPDGSAYAIRGDAFADQVGDRDCSALVTMAEAGAGARRDLVLLLIGAFFSLGAALLLEVALDVHRRRLEAAAPNAPS